MKTLRKLLGLKKSKENEEAKVEKSIVRTIFLGKHPYSADDGYYIARGVKLEETQRGYTFVPEEEREFNYHTSRSMEKFIKKMTLEMDFSFHESIIFQNSDEIVVRGIGKIRAGGKINGTYDVYEMNPLNETEMNQFREGIKAHIEYKNEKVYTPKPKGDGK
jgi:hypothetical protein